MKNSHLINIRDDEKSKHTNHYDTRLYLISLFREAGCAMFGFMLYSRRRSCFSSLANFRSLCRNYLKTKRSFPGKSSRE